MMSCREKAGLPAWSDRSTASRASTLRDRRQVCGYILASDIGMALYAREKTGLGQQVQGTMFETILSFTISSIFGVRHSIRRWTPCGLRTSIDRPPPALPTRTDILRTCVNDEQWKRILPALAARI